MAIEAKGRRHRVPRIVLTIAGPVALVAVLGQALLPSIAANRVRAKLQRYGTVSAVSVSALPAIELLWGKVDSVSVSASSLTLSLPQIATLLSEARGVGEITASVRHVSLRVPGLPSGLSVSDVRMTKRGSSVLASATVTQAQLDEALPSGVRVRLALGGSEGVRVRASGALFGVSTSIEALVRPREGSLVAEPQGLPLASLATVTLFSDPHLRVRSVAAEAIAGQPLEYRLSLGASIG